MINQYLEYAAHIGLDQFGLDWVKNVVGAAAKKKELSTEEVEHILDFLSSDAAPKRISKMSYPEAKASAAKWLASQIKKGTKIKELPADTETVLDLGDGFRVVRLVGQNAYKREGFLMSHCVAGYYGRDVEVYSLRDGNNMPHATMEKNQQIKGKGNGDIHPRYVGYVVKFLEHIGMSVGDSEMAHLGYINLEEFKDELASELFNGKYHPRNQKLLGKDGHEFADLALWGKVPLVEFTSQTEFRINFDLASFIVRAVSKLFEFLKNMKASKETKSLTDQGKEKKEIGSSGHSAQIGSSGNSARIGSSGNSAQIGSSGESAQIGSSGNFAQIGSSGNFAQIGSSGYDARIELDGVHSVGMAAGHGSTIRGKKGCWITLAEWKDEGDKRIPVCVKSAQIDGVTLKEDTFYKLEGGEFEEVLSGETK